MENVKFMLGKLLLNKMDILKGDAFIPLRASAYNSNLHYNNLLSLGYDKTRLFLGLNKP